MYVARIGLAPCHKTDPANAGPMPHIGYERNRNERNAPAEFPTFLLSSLNPSSRPSGRKAFIWYLRILRNARFMSASGGCQGLSRREIIGGTPHP
jgi:hypothetical protein